MRKSNSKSNNKNRKKKIHLVFDEQKRREFLTGFHKRKLQRKKQAQEKFENVLKEERKRLKQEAKESYKKLVQSHKPIPELEDLLADEYEDDDTNVKVLELSSFALANQNSWIGSNHSIGKCDIEESSINERVSDEDSEDQVPGMELKPSTEVKSTQSGKTFASEKELKRALKKEATKKVQKSKVFQIKNKLERQKQKKKSLQQKRLNAKLHNKMKKSRGPR